MVGVWGIVLLSNRKGFFGGMKSLVCIVFIAACGASNQPVNQPTPVADNTCELRLEGALEYGKMCSLYRDSYQDSLKQRAETIRDLEHQVEYLTTRLGEANSLVSVYESQLLNDGCVTKRYKIESISIDDTKVLGDR